MEDRIYIDRRIHELLAKGVMPITIAHELGCQIGRVYYQRTKFRSGLDWRDRPRRGAPRKLSATSVPLVKRVLKRADVQTPARAALRLKTKHGIDVSESTVRRTIKREGMRYRIKPIKPQVSPADEAARVAFARRNRGKGYWDRVWWSDEKAFEIRNEPRGIWVDVHDEVPVRQEGLVPETLRVWGAISYWGQSKLFKIPSFWTAPEYKTHLEKNALPDLRKRSGGNFVLEQDGDGAHRGNVVVDFLRTNEVTVLDDLPAHSPDIPPIENMWKLTMDKVKYRNPKTKDGFWKILKEEWDNFPLEEIRKLTGSLPNRCKALIDAEGKPIKY